MPASTSFLEEERMALMGFEGAEKKMEVIFSSVKEDSTFESKGLRTYGLKHWSAVVATLNGTIIKNDTSEEFDLYLISESSLFVYSDRVIILTCGTTTLLKALPSILESGRNLDMDMIWFQFSRKNFLYPEEQLFPHKSFDQEVKFCTEMFSDGQPHILGPLNGDHWYVFIADRIPRDEFSDTRLDRESTLNIYMYGIDQDVAQLFMKSEEMILPSILDSKDNVKSSAEISIPKLFSNSPQKSFSFVTSAAEATSRSGIGRLLEDDDGKVVHDHLFDPCGYSMNGIVAKNSYWTIHITPEAHCSYVSFETNLAPASYDDLIARVISTFQPQRVTTVVQADRLSPLRSSASKFSHLDSSPAEGYSVSGQSLTEIGKSFAIHLVNYEATFQVSDDSTWTSSTSSSQSSLE